MRYFLVVLFLFPPFAKLGDNAVCCADVIENDASLTVEFPPEHYEFTLTESQNSGGLLLFEFFDTVDDGDVIVSYRSIHELVAIYEVKTDVLFNTSYVRNNDPLSINDNSINHGVFSIGIGESTYLGYVDDRHDFESNNPFGFDSKDNFGWAEITRTIEGLEITASATAFNNGIIIGSTDKVPEPSSFVLIASCAFCLFSRRRCTRFGDQHRL